MKYFITVLALLFFIVYLVQIDYGLLATHLGKVGFGMVWIILSSGLAYLLAAIGWGLCFSAHSKGQSIKNLFVSRLIGESFGTVNPTGIVGGDVLKVFLLKKHGVNGQEATNAVAISRALILLSFILLIIFGLSYILLEFDLSVNIWLHSILIFLLTSSALLLILSFFHPSLLLFKAFEKLAKHLNFQFLKKNADNVKNLNFASSQFYKRNLGKFILAFVFFLLHWICGALEYYVTLLLLGIDISFFSAFILEIGTSFMRGLVPFIPGQLGVEEYSNKLFMSILGANQNESWVAVSMIRRVRQLFWIGTAFITYFIFYKQPKEDDLGTKIIDNGSLVH